MKTLHLSRMSASIAAISMTTLGLLFPSTASAFPPLNLLAPPSPVIEYRNSSTGHYFYTAFPEEAAAVDAGGLAGSGWRRTGRGFLAYRTPADSTAPLGRTCPDETYPCVPIVRFFSASANSHFFTGDPAEAAMVGQPGTGWSREGIGFYLPMPRAGQCAGDLTAVVRFVSPSGTNHRYAADVEAMRLARGAGWREEGVAFCAYGPFVDGVAMRLALGTLRLIGTVLECKAETPVPRSCVAFGNLPVPTFRYSGTGSNYTDSRLDAFNLRTGIAQESPEVLENIGLEALSRELAASQVFVQLTPRAHLLGLHLTTRSRGAPVYSNIIPLHKLPTAAPAPGAADTRFFPWRVRDSAERELRFGSFLSFRDRFAEPGGQAYVNSVIEFIDARSGGRVRFNAFAASTYNPGSHGVGRDKDGVLIVGVGSPASPYSRNDSAFFPQYGTVRDGFQRFANGFALRMSRAEFVALIAAARTLDPVLSNDPADYLVDHFGLNLEVAGDGEIGLTMESVSLELMPTQ